MTVAPFHDDQFGFSDFYVLLDASGSLWPPIIMHWIGVAALFGFGGIDKSLMLGAYCLILLEPWLDQLHLGKYGLSCVPVENEQ
eukprot:3196727-Amphidinium_carterae.1